MVCLLYMALAVGIYGRVRVRQRQDAPGKQARGAVDRLGSIRNATRFRRAAAQTGDNGRGLPRGVLMEVSTSRLRLAQPA